jgi:uncharacterized protein YbgA (DUF1722 family)/uncharacterized protein YbbK (DUF523 family)
VIEVAPEIKLGISACLLGQKVRHDGGHKRDAFLTDLLGRFVTFVPVCPEVELGMGTPREPIRLERGPAGVRLVAPGSGKDHTAAMRRYAERRVAELSAHELSGYVLKQDSPSCGMERVRVWGRGTPARDGRGAFAAVLTERHPLLPVEEEGRLQDPALRESFVERVFAYHRLRTALGSRFGVGDLVRFHTAEKLLVLAHHPEAYRRLGRVVAGAKRLARDELRRRYSELYMSALARLATRGRHANVLQHMAGHLVDLASADDRAELSEVIDAYRRGLVPLVVPVTLLRHHVRRHGVTYLAQQRYLDPHPAELMLRNHV